MTFVKMLYNRLAGDPRNLRCITNRNVFWCGFPEQRGSDRILRFHNIPAINLLCVPLVENILWDPRPMIDLDRQHLCIL